MVRAGFLQFLQGIPNTIILRVAKKINEEEIIPGLSPAGPGLDFAEVDSAGGKGIERRLQSPNLIGQRKY
tara:strand:+ start:370 stop:579 length:210 start_codon:yes stop_codon:yes gene_type:complete